MKLFEVITGIKGKTEGPDRDLGPVGHHFCVAETIGHALNQVAKDPVLNASFTITYLGEIYEPGPYTTPSIR